MSEEIRLIYFDIRGLVEPVRWMMRVAGVPFVDERIPLAAWATSGKKGTLSNLMSRRRSSTGEETNSYKNFIGQLPVMLVGKSFMLSQPLTVCRYLARRCGFSGNNPLEETRAEEVSDLIYDLRLRAFDYMGKAYKSLTPDIGRHTVFRDLRNSPDTPAKIKMQEEFTQIYFPLYFSKFNSIIEDGGGEWVAGETLTYGDFVLGNFLEIAEDLVDPNCLNEFPKLKELKDKILAMPEIVEWREGAGKTTLSQGAADEG